MMPFIEMRLAIPYGIAAGMNPVFVYVVCCAVNIAIIPLLFWAYEQFFELLCSSVKFGGTFMKMRDKTHRRAAKLIDTYGPIGLLIFVAIPLPGTGAYSGCLAAYLLEMPKARAAVSIAVGILVAAAFILAASVGVINLL
jgi:uncharacterized membrane protein